MNKQNVVEDKIQDFYNQEPRYKFTIEYYSFKFDIELHRRLTILQGDSATGKTTLANIIDKYVKENRNEFRLKKQESTVKINCQVKFSVNPNNIKELESSEVVILDEEHDLIYNKELLVKYLNEGYFFVIITRDKLLRLSHSISEVYKIQDGRLVRVYDKVLPTKNIEESSTDTFDIKYIDEIVLEDSKSGFELYENIFKNENTKITSTNGKNNIIPYLLKLKDSNELLNKLIVIDSANYGQHINELLSLLNGTNSYIIAYESLEFMILETLDIFNNLMFEVNNNFKSFSKECNYNLERMFTELINLATTYMNSNSRYKFSDTMSEEMKLITRTCPYGEYYSIQYSKSKLNNILINKKEETVIKLEIISRLKNITIQHNYVKNKLNKNSKEFEWGE